MGSNSVFFALEAASWHQLLDLSHQDLKAQNCQMLVWHHRFLVVLFALDRQTGFPAGVSPSLVMANRCFN